MTVFDSNLMLRTTGTLTADATLGPVTIYGGRRKGYAARAIIPTSFGINDTVQIRVWTSTDGSTYNQVAQSWGAQKPAGATMELIVPFAPPPGKTYVKVELDVTVASTTGNFGTAIVGIVDNPGFVQDRDAGYQFR